MHVQEHFYPEAALADAAQALKDAREVGQATSLMFALGWPTGTLINCGDYTIATRRCDELIALADEKSALYWKAMGMLHRGRALALTGRATDELHTMISGINAWHSTGSTVSMPFWLSYLARVYAVLCQFDDAWRYISEAMKAIETTSERASEAEVNRVASEIALMTPEPDTVRGQNHFERVSAMLRVIVLH